MASSIRTWSKRTRIRRHRGLPELVGVHLAETLIALDRLAARTFVEDVREHRFHLREGLLGSATLDDDTVSE